MVKIFQHKGVVDSTVVNTTIIKSILNIVAFENLHLQQLDVNRAFILDDNLEHDIHKTQPKIYRTFGKKNLVKKNKTLYGMNQIFNR